MMHSIGRKILPSFAYRIWIEHNRCSRLLCRAIHVNSIFVSKRICLAFYLWPNYDWHRRWICIRPIVWNWTNSMFRARMRPIAHRSQVVLRDDCWVVYWMCSTLRTDTIAIPNLWKLRETEYEKKKNASFRHLRIEEAKWFPSREL